MRSGPQQSLLINKLNLAKKVILSTGTFQTEAEPKYGSNESKIELDGNIMVHRNFGDFDQSETRIACGGHVC
jgi:hypothetical protein